MSIKTKQLMIIKSAGLTYKSASAAFGMKPNVSSAKLGRGITSIKDLIKLCNYCGAEITIKLKDGTIMPLNENDL